MKLSVRQNFENVPPEQLFLGILLFIMLAMSFLQVKEGFETGAAMAAQKVVENPKKKAQNPIAAAAMMVASKPPAGAGGVTQPEPFSLYKS